MDPQEQHLLYLDNLVNHLIATYQPKRVLDVGCGGGSMVSLFKKRNVIAYGIDASPETFCSCLADASLLPFKNSSFDMITAHHVMEHLIKPGLFLLEAKRLLDNGGVLIAITPTLPFGNRWLWKTLGIQRHPDHVSMHTPAWWRSLFREYGFELKGDLRDFAVSDTPSHFIIKRMSKFGSFGKYLQSSYLRKYRASFIACPVSPNV